MSRKNLLIGLLAAGLFTALGASAATSQNAPQSFERQQLQDSDIVGLDRLECLKLKRQGAKLPAYCISH